MVANICNLHSGSLRQEDLSLRSVGATKQECALKQKRYNLILRTFIKARTERTLSSYLPTDAGPMKTLGLVTYIRHRSMLMQEGYQEPRTESEASHTSSEYTHSVQCGNCPQVLGS